ncbi:hypothetical protein PV10_08264 [Exophiala mesophila]|uniref:C2H2-type domain-containing protein n=1 Tax=Exophiala mesophila TaxID=212818 RepID=A0A0D1XK90_EXOME|nr:uncharacterized protein PV10_08264 [Exophiala mesophila]KIV88596.1 hypothetical protein PV10_08264 [Exophiala mesophila]
MLNVVTVDGTELNDNVDCISPISGSNNNRLIDILRPILRCEDLSRFCYAVYAYLRLPAEHWRAVQKLRESQTTYNIMRYHWNLWDIVPDTLWHSVVQVREDAYFERVQTDLVRVFDSHISFLMPIREMHSRSQSLTSSNGGLIPTFGFGDQVLLQNCRQSCHGSGVHRPAFAAELSPQTQTSTHSMTPSIVDRSSPSHSLSPWTHKKGKAPPGQVYVCPVAGCAKKGFRNVGNYINHMLKHHRDHPRHDPETSLQDSVTEATEAVDSVDDLILQTHDLSASREMTWTKEQDDGYQPVNREPSSSGCYGSSGTENHESASSFSCDDMSGNDPWRTKSESLSAQGFEVEMEMEKGKGKDFSHTNGGSWSESWTFGMFQASLLGGK